MSTNKHPMSTALPRSVYHWLQNTHYLVYPPRCALCDAPGSGGLDLCEGCHADLPWLLNACRYCAEPLATSHQAVCRKCQKQPPIFDSAAAALRYTAPANWLITRLKFHRHLSHARILGALLAERVAQEDRPNVLLPVPLHPTRRRERGFNQAAEIAATTSRRLGIRTQPGLATRARATARQAELHADQRRANVRGAFAASQRAAGLDIAIIDDVATTGHTATELARTLKRAGASRVRLWTAARA